MVSSIANLPTSWSDVWEDIESQVANGSRGINSFDLNYYQIKQGVVQWTDVIGTVYGHFSALYAYFITFSSPTPSTFGGSNMVTYEKVLIELLNNAGNPNTRRTKFDVKWKNGGAGLMDLMKWLTTQMVDADQAVYDWYPANTGTGWSPKLGNPKTYPPLTVVMGATAAPNQYKANGPYLNYVYGAGRKNAVSNNLLVFDDRTLINDYAKYKSPPGFRNTPYPTPSYGGSQMNQPQQVAKEPYQDWKDKPYNTQSRYAWRSIKPLPGMSAADPLFWAFQDSLVGTPGVPNPPRSRPILGNRILTPIRDGEPAQAARRTVILDYPTINFDKRYLRFVDKV